MGRRTLIQDTRERRRAEKQARVAPRDVNSGVSRESRDACRVSAEENANANTNESPERRA